MERARARQVDLREEVPLRKLEVRDDRMELPVADGADLADEVDDALERLRAVDQSTTDDANLARGHVDREGHVAKGPGRLSSCVWFTRRKLFSKRRSTPTSLASLTRSSSTANTALLLFSVQLPA